MASFDPKRCCLWITRISVLFIFLCILVDYSWNVILVAFAEGQTETFEEMRLKAAAPGPADVSYLRGVLDYYPSGSKEAKGSRLDRIVERARQSAVREIIASLKAKTGRDLGDDPRIWIERLDVHEDASGKMRRSEGIDEK